MPNATMGCSPQDWSLAILPVDCGPWTVECQKAGLEPRKGDLFIATGPYDNAPQTPFGVTY